jgi:hypothetical protein
MLSRLPVVLVSLLFGISAVIFWLCLLIVPARVAEPCSEECECMKGGIVIVCSAPSLTAPPSIRLRIVRKLGLFRLNITSLEKDSFVSRGLTQLEVLHIEECRLRTIDVGAFNGLTELTEVTIKVNEISEIIPGTFENLNSLVRLDLSYNSIEHLDRNAFSGLVKLNYIDLGENKLQYLHPDTFLELPSIKYVILGENPGLQIPTDSNFINSHSLLHLDISYCNVSSVSGETFANISAVKWLDLSNNNLMSLDINTLRALPKLSTLLLSRNQLQCDCQLQEVWRWCEDRNITTGYVDCDTPSEVKGIWWGVLEKGQCLEGNIQYDGDYKSTRYRYTDIAVLITDEDTDTNTDTK